MNGSDVYDILGRIVHCCKEWFIAGDLITGLLFRITTGDGIGFNYCNIL